MFSVVQRFLDWIKSLFWKEEMELTLVGLQYSGKSTFVHVIATGSFTEDMTPTVGFVMRKITKGAVTIKMWDIGGQPRFRSMWERYCRGVNAVVFMVDSADFEKLDAAQTELHLLLERPQLVGIPLLVLGNKRDLPNALDENGLISKLGLARITDREVCCYSISCKSKQNLDVTLKWLIAHAGSKAKQAPTGLTASRSNAAPPVVASPASSSSPNLQAVSSAVHAADAPEPVAKVHQAQAAISSNEASATSSNSGAKQSKAATPNFLSDQPPSPPESVQNESDWSMHAAVEPIADQQPTVAEN